jgi:sensor c-di-GMP phosphodiesterase-like protein
VIDLDTIYDAFRANEFFLEYLPTVSLEDGRCLGAEALVRWQRPDGIVPPQMFIPLIEHTPMAGMLTYWVMETAANELGDWLRGHDGIHLSINVPPEILGRGGLEYVGAKLGWRDLADKLVFEITERGIPDKLGADSIGEAVRRYGVRVALDDVSVSGANIIVLSRCRIAIIKIDKELVAEIGRTHTEPVWLAGLSSILLSTPLEVIAEGVESAEQIESLRAAGIRMAQGYHFSPPVRAQAFLEYFAAHKPPQDTATGPSISR